MALFVYMRRDIRQLVHGDDLLVEMPRNEEKWFESVLCSRSSMENAEDSSIQMAALQWKLRS